jgi:hypothetical protein
MNYFFLILMAFTVNSAYCQDNELKAIAYYTKAEEAFNTNNWEETIGRLTSAESALGTTNSKILYLKVNALNKLCDINLWYLDSMKRVCDRFFAVTNKDDFPTEKYLDIVNISIAIPDKQKKYEDDFKLGRTGKLYLVAPLMKCRIFEDQTKGIQSEDKDYLKKNKIIFGEYPMPTALSNGDKYYGELNSDGKKMNGGLYIWANGEIYRGGFTNDTREGQGKYLWPNGDTYEGHWNNNEPDEGVFTMARQDSIRGAFSSYDFSYKGRFKDGKKYGIAESKETRKIFDKYSTESENCYKGNFHNTRKRVSEKRTTGCRLPLICIIMCMKGN